MLNRRVADQVGAGRFVSFSRDEWAAAARADAAHLTEAEL